MRHILMTWNPEENNDAQWDPEGWQDQMVDVATWDQPVQTSWSVGQRINGIEPEDWAYLFRQGNHGRGLVAIGKILTDPESGPHWIEPGKTCNYVEIAWFEALPLDQRITVQELQIAVPDFSWTQVYGSGREVLGDAGESLHDLWTQRTRGVQGPSPGSGGGFGDPDTNALVEQEAMDVVTDTYEAEGYAVEDVSEANCGWDLTARKADKEVHVEVKGVAGPDVKVLLTVNEHRTAGMDANWVLVVVTNAMSNAPGYFEVDPEVVAEFAKPFTYQVSVPVDRFD